jgi:tRNA A-37 threonylcarbamoyl transferase component Bud32
MAMEARVMEHVRTQGFPVPAVEELSDDGLDIVMERLEGADMVATMSKRPWTIPHQGRVLADLHSRLHELAAPDWLRDAPVGQGSQLLHLDLHPLNVMIGPQGPYVIDWTNASRGVPTVDVAVAWVLMKAGEVPAGQFIGAILGKAGSTLVKSFLRSFDLEGDEVKLRLHDCSDVEGVGSSHVRRRTSLNVGSGENGRRRFGRLGCRQVIQPLRGSDPLRSSELRRRSSTTGEHGRGSVPLVSDDTRRTCGGHGAGLR